ncbi:MAG: DUF4317 domain-containing protein [Clostridia bacterium]|nr:DUF4317 domain-containing protein [Clostridia bacterium]
MNQKELNEIRRRIAPGKNNMGKLYGCYVNYNKEIIAKMDVSMGLMPEIELEKFIALFRGALGGTLGKNLLNLQFTNEQITDGAEHKLLNDLRKDACHDEEMRNKLYDKIIAGLETEEMNWLILIAGDSYDVPKKTKNDDFLADGSDTVFNYMLCAICPVKDGKAELGYFANESQFHSYAAKATVSAPMVGFMFPAFDDRATNIHNALFFTKDVKEMPQGIIENVFGTAVPLSSAEQRDAFQAVLAETLEEECSFDVVQAVHEQLREKMAQHKESKDPEPLDITPRDVGVILENTGVGGEKVQAFQQKCGEEFGTAAAFNPVNIIDASKFELVTPQVKISVDPKFSYMVETKVIDGKKYVLIPADEGVEVNGVAVKITD